MIEQNPTSATTAGGVDERVRAITASLDGDATAYLARVRHAAARLARRDVADDDVRAALEDLS